MQISRDLMKSYFRILTLGRGSVEPDPMADLSLFDTDAIAMRDAAETAGDLEWLRLSMDALIANPTGRIDQFVGQGYPYSNADMVALMTHAYKLIWPEHALSDPGDEASFEFVDMTEEAWARIRTPSEEDDVF